MGNRSQPVNHLPLATTLLSALLLAIAPAHSQTVDRANAQTEKNSPTCALKILVQRIAADGSASTVNPEETKFASGDRIRLRCETPRDAYVYVIQQGSSGTWSVLYPSVQSHSKRPRAHVIPGEEDSPFIFDLTPGEEHLVLIASDEPVNLEGIADRLNGSSNNSSTTAAASVRPRDLVFEREETKTGSGPIAACVKSADLVQYEPILAHVALTHTGDSNRLK